MSLNVTTLCCYDITLENILKYNITKYITFRSHYTQTT